MVVHITPLKWRYLDNTGAMERARARINRAVIQSVVAKGGYAIKHPKNPALICDDCHLSYIGNDLFLNTFETFIRHPEIKIYPVE